MLRVSVRKRFGDFLLDASWTSRERIVALVGPSGSGKTLTLQCLAGLIAPEAGHIEAGGRVLFDHALRVNLAPQNRRVGYVFQGYALFPHMTVRQNVAYGVRAGAKAHSGWMDEVIGRLGLAPLASRYPSELSGGQQQRVALARALSTDPDLLLLDEPLSALDAPLRRDLSAELSQTLRSWGKLVVLVTHDLSEAYQIADEVVLYDEGRTTEAAPKNDLLWNPSSERVARLIGARNILRARVVRLDEDSILLDWREGTLVAARAPNRRLALRPGETVAFFIRPEYVQLIRKDRPHGRYANVFRGAIVGERDEGAAWTLFFKVFTREVRDPSPHDLEITIPKLVYERLAVSVNREWEVSIHPGSIQVLPH